MLSAFSPFDFVVGKGRVAVARGPRARLPRLSCVAQEGQGMAVSPLLQSGFICIWLSERPRERSRDWALRAWHVLTLLGNLPDCLSPGAQFLKSDPSRRPHWSWHAQQLQELDYENTLEVRITVTGFSPSFQVPSESKNSLLEFGQGSPGGLRDCRGYFSN